MNLPVGLLNIGNTCYLNSLLQYLFTVKAVREIVLNHDKYNLELKDEDIPHRTELGKLIMKRFQEEYSRLVADIEVRSLTA